MLSELFFLQEGNVADGESVKKSFLAMEKQKGGRRCVWSRKVYEMKKYERKSFIHYRQFE